MSIYKQANMWYPKGARKRETSQKPSSEGLPDRHEYIGPMKRRLIPMVSDMPPAAQRKIHTEGNESKEQVMNNGYTHGR